MVLQDCENQTKNLIDAASELDDGEWEAFVETVKEYLDEKDSER